MSLKIKIILFISILIILSLGTTLFFLSYHEYKPALKNEIIQRIDAQLNNMLPVIMQRVFFDENPGKGKSKEKDELNKTDYSTSLKRILKKNNEIIFIKILKGKNIKDLRYQDIITKNYLIFKQEDKDEILMTRMEVVPELKGMKVNTGISKVSLAVIFSNNTLFTLSSKISSFCLFDIKKFLIQDGIHYKTAISNINVMITKLDKERKNNGNKIFKMMQPSLNAETLKIINSLLNNKKIYEKIINKLPLEKDDDPSFKLINENLNALLTADIKELNEKAFPAGKSRIKKDYYQWQIENLISINNILKKMYSRIQFINKKSLNKTTGFYETGYDYSLGKKNKQLTEKTEKIILFYRPLNVYKDNYGIFEVGISEKEIMKKINPIIRNGIFSSSIIIVFSILAALLLSLYLIFPIHVLEKGADEILKDIKFKIKLKRKDEFGKLAHTFNHLSGQLTEELSKYEKLYNAATEDELTKLMVRRYFMEIMRSELKNAASQKRSTSLFMTDIDHFKKFNDTYGHQTGDMVLAKVAEILLHNTRKNRVRNDIAGRYGGEEFSILLPDTNKENAMQSAERIRSEVENMSLQSAKGELLKVTISIGVSTSENSDISMQELIEKADKALYHSKETGRNKVSASQ